MFTRGTFDHQLNTLEHRVLRMGGLVQEAIELAMSALLTRDTPLAERVLNGDEDINRQRFDIEEDCYALLALQQPLARDLRVVAAAVTAVVNLERIGDHAVSVAVLARRLNQEPLLPVPANIVEMGQMARSFLRRALDAYISHDAAMAAEIAQEDAQLNRLNGEVVQELIGVMSRTPAMIRQGTYYIWISHRLERIGDCVKNLCERTVYITSNQLFDFDRHSEWDDLDVDGEDER